MTFFSARFAITSAGFLTVAQARLALANRDLARQSGGAFALRWNDIGHPDPDACERIRQDLRWLGIAWDAEFHQSERAPLYAAAIAGLQAANRLYPCFENDDELRFKRERRARAGKPVVYDRAMLKLTPAQRAAAEANGKRPYWRFLLSDTEITWKDSYHGRQQVKLPGLSDPVLVSADGAVQPTLAGAIDDIDLGIGLLARGADEVANSAIQYDIRAALGTNPGRIALAHLPPLIDADKGKRARALEKLTIRQLQHDGIEAAALAAYLTELSAPTNTAPRFDSTLLLALNRQTLADIPFVDIAPRLPAGATEAFWNAIRGYIDLSPEARVWWAVTQGEIVAPILENAMDFLSIAHDRMLPAPWNTTTWPAWLAALEIDAAHPNARLLYLALTGEEQGPPMATLLPLIARPRVERRLQALSQNAE